MSGITKVTIRACILTAMSNIIAQYLAKFRKSPTIVIDKSSLLQFVIYCAIKTPPNFVWQQAIESSFPAQALQQSRFGHSVPAVSDDKALHKKLTSQPTLEPRVNVRNTIVKFCLDQSFGAAINTFTFSLIMASLRGATWEEAVHLARQDFWPLLKAAWKLWPIISLLNFSLVRSVQTRTLVINLASMAWNIYLSLLAPTDP